MSYINCPVSKVVWTQIIFANTCSFCVCGATTSLLFTHYVHDILVACLVCLHTSDSEPPWPKFAEFANAFLSWIVFWCCYSCICCSTSYVCCCSPKHEAKVFGGQERVAGCGVEKLLTKCPACLPATPTVPAFNCYNLQRMHPIACTLVLSAKFGWNWLLC